MRIELEEFAYWKNMIYNKYRNLKGGKIMGEKRKVNLSTVIFVLIILVLLIIIGGMWYHYNNSDENNANTIASEENQVKKINKKEEEKEIVYTSYSKESSEYSYAVPYININSEDVEKINEEIKNEFMSLIEEALQNEKEGSSIVLNEVKYNSYLNDNILSVIISGAYQGGDYKNYKVYNVDIYTGKSITNL